MDQLEIDQAVIGGLSMGGYVALAFVKQFPVARESVGARGHAPQATLKKESRRGSTSEKALRKEWRASRCDVAEVVDARHRSKRPEVVKRVRDMMLKTKPEGAAMALLGMAERDDQTEFISSIRVPTLILVGREDAITPVADSEKMHSQIEGSRLVVIENAGHVSNLSRPSNSTMLC
jgi:pimeloyl-ACP methyl ester carboxylesterase